MELSYEEALTLFRSWKQAEHLPTLVAEFQIASLAIVHARCEEIDVSDDTLTLWFGRLAWGNGQLNLPLRKAHITVLLRDDEKPRHMRADNEHLVVRWIQFNFPCGRENEGCLITEFKPGVFVTISGFGQLDFTATSSDTDAAEQPIEAACQ